MKLLFDENISHKLVRALADLYPDCAQAPSGATEVLVTYAEEFPETERDYRVGALAALRGRGKGEQLVKRLLQARREDREQDGRDRRSVRP